MPKGCVTLEGLSAQIGKQLPPHAGSWEYYKLIMQYAKENPDKCMPNYDSAGQHDMWPKDMSEAERKLYENQLKGKLKETAEQIQKQGGHIPGELSEIIKALKDKPPVFNWKKYFRRLVGNAITSEIQLTRMRPSKRLPDAKGIRLKRKPKILVAVDTSGSISSNDLAEFFGEIHHIYKSGVNVDVIEFDTKIQKEFSYRAGTEVIATGRGGTEASCAIDHYNERKNKYSTLIIFTDGYLSTFDLPKCQSLIWVITKDGYKTDKYPGKVVYIP